MLQQDEMLHATAQICKRDIEEILYQYYPFIHALARKHIPQSIIRREVLDLEVDELAQIILLSLWQALKKQEIYNIKAYIRRIVKNEVIDMLRRHRPIVPLNVEEDGELSQAPVAIAYGQRMQDPFEVVEQEELLNSYSGNLAQNVQALPPQQQRAMICMLKEKIADLLPLVDMFQPYNIDVESMNWPETENELRSARVSLSLARKKVRTSKKTYIKE